MVTDRLTQTTSRATALQALAIILITAAAYAPAVRAGYVWNDYDLTENIVLQQDGLFRVWFTTESTNYWPLVWTSYWLEHQFWGLDPAGYHVVNIALHALASLLVGRVLLRLGVPTAWLAALIFAIHPVNVESVAWVTQRKNVLSLLFFLAAALSFLRHEDRGKRGAAWGAVLLFLLAMLSKGAAAPLPVVLLLCVWWRRGAIRAADVFRVLPFFIVALGMSAVEIWFQYVRAIGDDVVREDSFLSRLAGAGWVVWFYLGKALLPVNLSFVYPRWEIDPADWKAHVPNLALLGLFTVAWWNRRRWGRPLLFALGYYVVMLAPVLGFLNIYFMMYSFVADHYQYFAIIAPIALVTGTASSLFARWSHEHTRFSSRSLRHGARAVAALVVLVLAGLTWQQTWAYENAEALWRDTIRKNPDAWLAHYNLGNVLRDRGQLDEAAHHFAETARIVPDDAWAYTNLGEVRQRQGRLDEAIGHFEQALRLDPQLAKAWYNLADIHQQRDELESAEALYRDTLRLDPGFAPAHNNLGVVLERLGRPEEAIRHFRQALQLEPANAQAHYNLGRVMLARGERVAAAVHFREAARLDPRLTTPPEISN